MTRKLPTHEVKCSMPSIGAETNVGSSRTEAISIQLRRPR
jgi:hypothetical protein